MDNFMNAQPSYGGAPQMTSYLGNAPGAPGYPPPAAGSAYPPPASAYPQGPPGGTVPPPAGAVPPPAGAVVPQAAAGDSQVAATDLPVLGPEPTAPTLEDVSAPPAEVFNLNAPPDAQAHRTYGNVPVINEEQARQALEQEVAQHCCWGSKPAKEMQFRDLQSSSAFHYTLETFVEGRAERDAWEPYVGQAIDGPGNGIRPGPWQIQMQPRNMFENSKVNVEIPHTANVQPCHHCRGHGSLRCPSCHGHGKVHCHSCNGRGETSYREPDGSEAFRRCVRCHGHGRHDCDRCHGRGRIKCRTCEGQCSLKTYRQLVITWTNNLNDHILERTALPDHLIREAAGQNVFEETYPRVWPLSNFPEQQINAASRQLVEGHWNSFPGKSILMQRHRLRLVPVTQVDYEHKNNHAQFFVYGFEHRVHAPNYPATCCCGCVLL